MRRSTFKGLLALGIVVGFRKLLFDKTGVRYAEDELVGKQGDGAMMSGLDGLNALAGRPRLLSVTGKQPRPQRKMLPMVKPHKTGAHKRSVEGLGCGCGCQNQMSGLGQVSSSSQYYQWYINSYLPWYYAQQRIPRCPSGYTYVNGSCQAPAMPQYNYQQQYQYGYGYSPQQCAQQGGLWDSFTGRCSSANPYQQQYQQPYGYGYTGNPQQCVQSGGLWDSFSNSCTSPSGGAATAAVGTGYPNVLGMAKWTAVSMLNNAGYSVWLLSEEGIPQGSPTDYQPKRVQIVVQNGVVTQVQVG